MKRTKHITGRMSQRGITGRMIELTELYGKKVGDKIILDKKRASNIKKFYEKRCSELLKIIDKGGVVLVENNNTLITVYNRDE